MKKTPGGYLNERNTNGEVSSESNARMIENLR